MNTDQAGLPILSSLRLAHGSLSREIIGCYFSVYNELGYGFLESVYQHAMAVALSRRGIACTREVPFPVFYEGVLVGEYRADLVVERQIIIEAKCADRIVDAHVAQTINYLKASQLRLALILNFGSKAVFRRLIL